MPGCDAARGTKFLARARLPLLAEHLDRRVKYPLFSVPRRPYRVSRHVLLVGHDWAANPCLADRTFSMDGPQVNSSGIGELGLFGLSGWLGGEAHHLVDQGEEDIRIWLASNGFTTYP